MPHAHCHNKERRHYNWKMIIPFVEVAVQTWELWDVLAGEFFAMLCSVIGLQLSLLKKEGGETTALTCVVSTFEIKLSWTCHLSSSKWWYLWSCLEPGGSLRSCLIFLSCKMLIRFGRVNRLITSLASQLSGCRSRRGESPKIHNTVSDSHTSLYNSGLCILLIY